MNDPPRTSASDRRGRGTVEHDSCFVRGVKSDISSAANNLIAGTFTKYLLLAFNIATGMFLMPFTVHHLGQAEYGLWMLVASMTYYFQLLDMGYGNGIDRHIVAADRQGDVNGVNRIASTFVCVYAAIGVAACGVVAGMIAWVVPRFPHLSPAEVRTAQAVMAIIGVRVALGFPMTAFGAVLTNTALTYVLLESGYGVVPLVAATTFVNILGYGGYAWTARHVFPE